MTTKDKVIRLLDKGMTAIAIAKKLGISNAYVHTIKWQANKAPQMKVANKKIKDKPTKLIVRSEHLNKALDLLRDKFPPDTKDVDLVNHPAHYKAGGIETIDFIEAKDLNYRLGNVVKYVSRAGKKATDPLEDLKKAEFYLKREIVARERA